VPNNFTFIMKGSNMKLFSVLWRRWRMWEHLAIDTFFSIIGSFLIPDVIHSMLLYINIRTCKRYCICLSNHF